MPQKVPVFQGKGKGKDMGGSPGKGTGIGNSVPFREVKVMSSSTRFLKMMPDRYWRSSNPPQKNSCFIFSRCLFFLKRQLAELDGKHALFVPFLFPLL